MKRISNIILHALICMAVVIPAFSLQSCKSDETDMISDLPDRISVQVGKSLNIFSFADGTESDTDEPVLIIPATDNDYYLVAEDPSVLAIEGTTLYGKAPGTTDVNIYKGENNQRTLVRTVTVKVEPTYKVTLNCGESITYDEIFQDDIPWTIYDITSSDSKIALASSSTYKGSGIRALTPGVAYVGKTTGRYDAFSIEVTVKPIVSSLPFTIPEAARFNISGLTEEQINAAFEGYTLLETKDDVDFSYRDCQARVYQAKGGHLKTITAYLSAYGLKGVGISIAPDFDEDYIYSALLSCCTPEFGSYIKNIQHFTDPVSGVKLTGRNYDYYTMTYDWDEIEVTY